MFGTNLSAVFLQHVIDALTPYPRGMLVISTSANEVIFKRRLVSNAGLLTNIGMVVANPASDSNRTNVHVLDRTAYHGTVVWCAVSSIFRLARLKPLSGLFSKL